MADSREVELYGGNAMIFDQYGLLKYNIGNSIFNAERQSRRLLNLWNSGYFDRGASKQQRFAAMHRDRMLSWSKRASGREAADWTLESREAHAR